MIFKLTTSGYIYDDEDRERLEALGFKFTPHKDGARWYIDSNFQPTIEFNSLDEFLLFVNEFRQVVVTDGEIEIYDGYRE